MGDPKRVVERHVEAFNAQDVDAAPWSDDAEVVAPNASVHGREEVLGFLGVFWDAFPDGRLEALGPSRRRIRRRRRGPVHRHAHRCHAHAGRGCRGHGTAGRPPLDVELTRFAATNWPRNISLRSGRAARPARTDAGDLSALLPCASSGSCVAATARPPVVAPTPRRVPGSFLGGHRRLYPLRRGVALECLLERRDVGDLNDPPDPIRARRVPEGAHRDSERPEELLALR